MRRVSRPELDKATGTQLQQKQQRANNKKAAGTLDVTTEWKVARRTKPLITVLNTLLKMTGRRERCMYCLDSHGTDIEHFWPKADFPERMFSWLNHLLCCTECGRIKGNKFPTANGIPLLVDPTVDEPWQYLAFEPDTGNIVARYDSEATGYSERGTATVNILELDTREALAHGRLKTYARLSEQVNEFLSEGTSTADAFVNQLVEHDDYDLLGWCIIGSGGSEPPFTILRMDYPTAWQELDRVVRNIRNTAL